MDQVPYCSIHSFSPLQFILVQKERCNWICSSCYFNQKKNKQSNVVIDLFQIKQNSRKLQELFPQRFKQINKIKEPLEDTEKSLLKLKALMEDSIKQLNTMLEGLGVQLKKLKSRIVDLTKLYENCVQNDQGLLLDIIQGLIFQGPKINDEAKQQIEIKFHYHIQKLQQPDEEMLSDYLYYTEYQSSQFVNSKVANCYGNFKDNFKQMDSEMQIHIDKISKLPLYEYLHWQINPIKKIKKRDYVDLVNIYQEQNEKLDFKQFTNAILEKKNLLMIFSSQNKGGTIFGVYTPYRWALNESQGNEKENKKKKENISFIFSYNQKQIFSIKQQNSKWTQKIDDQYIRFGGTGQNDSDICIFQDFKKGYSELGKGFKTPSTITKENYQSYLFGGTEPNISECCVYEVEFS